MMNKEYFDKMVEAYIKEAKEEAENDPVYTTAKSSKTKASAIYFYLRCAIGDDGGKVRDGYKIKPAVLNNGKLVVRVETADNVYDYPVC